jgi:hypothetical protein
MKPMDLAWRLLKMPQQARDYATQIHEGQMYGEQPYMTHVEDVASGFDDPHLQRIAYLHDTVEDSETGIGEIHERFGEDVGHAIDALTRRQGERYFDYINRVKEHPEATQVKLADLHSNLKNNPNESLARRYRKAIGILTNKSEPMDLAMRLLKNEWDYVDDNVLPENDPHYIYPNEQMWNDEADDDLKEKTNALWEYIESMHPQDKLMMLNQMDNPMLAMGINTDPRNRADMTDEETEKYINDAIWEMMFDAWQDSALEMPGGIDFDLGGNRKSGEPGDPVRAHAVDPSQWKKLAGEPMDIAMRLLKAPVYEDAEKLPTEQARHYEMLPHLEQMVWLVVQCDLIIGKIHF